MDNNNKILTTNYPIGAVYISTIDTYPGEIFGGVWERLKDMFLLAAGDNFLAGSTGGEKEHILSEEEMPSHVHNNVINVTAHQASHEHNILSGGGKCTMSAGLGYGYCYAVGGPDNDTSGRDWRARTGTGSDIMNEQQPAIAVNYSISNDSAGKGNAHNNMPPYLAVFMWKRVK